MFTKNFPMNHKIDWKKFTDKINKIENIHRNFPINMIYYFFMILFFCSDRWRCDLVEDLGNLTYNKGKKCLILSKKIIILGEGGVGKTTLLLRYTTGKFSDDTKMTIGTDFFTKKVKYEHGDCDVYLRLVLWDFAGEERFRFLLSDYTKGSDIILVAFDLSRMKSLYHLSDWMQILESARTYQNDIPIYLIGNKQDLVSFKKPDYDYINKWIRDYRVTKYFECSSRSGYNVDEIFGEVTSSLIENPDQKNYFLLT